MFRDLQKIQTVFTEIAAHVGFSANLAYEAQTSSGEGLFVSGSYFPVLELQPALGRLLNSNDDKLVGESRVVVLSYNYWSSRFGLDPRILNKPVIVNGQSLTIVGVAPKGFDGTTIGMRPRVFVPITLRSVLDASTGWSLRTDYWAYLFARLRPGVTVDAARASLGTQYHAIINDVEAPLQKDMSAQTMARFRAKPILLAPGGRGQSSVPDEAKTPLRLLLGVTAFVLLIACANIANLLLARSAARAGEMAIRLSIGASRARLIGQLLTESLLLAVLGGIAGMVVAHWTLVLVISLLPPEVQHTITFSIGSTAILFGIGLTFATGLLFGLFPALHSTRLDLVSTLKNQAGPIVGVVEDAKYSEVKQKVPPQFFMPYRQDKEPGGMHVYVRTSGDLAQATSAITAVVKRLDPNLPIEALETLPEQVRNNTFLDRMMTTLSAAFALLATLLAAIGLYGVLAYTVAQRTREIGLRMALGAAPNRVRGMVLRQVAIMTLVGTLVGLAGALGVGKGAQSILFQMTGADPAVLALSAVALALVALCAGFIPAHRASRVDPMRALKYE
jgi:ABC-type antimicrobial peptide transport system permease subunit